MALLKDRLKDLAEGTGSVVAVVGEAGLGKSTLIAELKKSDIEICLAERRLVIVYEFDQLPSVAADHSSIC